MPVPAALIICRVGQDRKYTPYMTVYLVISLPKIQYIHRMYMVLANPNYMMTISKQNQHCDCFALALANTIKRGKRGESAEGNIQVASLRVSLMSADFSGNPTLNSFHWYVQLWLVL